MPRPHFPPQVVTAESTASLEELIKQRIIDGAFDDVEAKVPIEVKARKQREGVSDEKSAAGLGEVYEQDYVKEALGVQPTDKLSAEKQEIAQLFTLLSQKLDALTNFHFTPKPLQADMQVKSNNLPSIAMEDVTPAAVRCVHAMPAGLRPSCALLVSILTPPACLSRCFHFV